MENAVAITSHGAVGSGDHGVCPLRFAAYKEGFGGSAGAPLKALQRLTRLFTTAVGAWLSCHPSFREGAVFMTPQGEPATHLASLGEAGRSALPRRIGCVSQLQEKMGFDTDGIVLGQSLNWPFFFFPVS